MSNQDIFKMFQGYRDISCEISLTLKSSCCDKMNKTYFDSNSNLFII